MAARLRPALAAIGLALALALAAPARASGDRDEVVDGHVRQGDETPQAAIDSLRELGSQEGGAAEHRAVLAAIGIVAAHDGRVDEALAQAEALRTLAPAGDALSQADARVVRAELEVNAGHVQAAYAQAREALRGYAPACDPGPQQRADCDWRMYWRALDLAEHGAADQGNAVVAAAYARSMLDVARRAGDRRREALSLALSGRIADANLDTATANRQLAQAERLARLDGSPWVEVRVTILWGLVHSRHNQLAATRRDFESALPIAQAAGLGRETLTLRANLSDVYIREGRPRDALAAIKLALPVARMHHDLRTERLLLHNQTLAKLALGRLAEAKADMLHVLELWKRDTGPGQQQRALREFGDALAWAGDVAGALELFHREDALARQIQAANKSAAEAELRARYDQESQKRRIELLARDNQLKTAQLENQAIANRLWMVAGLAMSLLGVLAVLMYLRMRELNRTLVRHEALLRAHSERDALTGLANRRQFREVMRLRGGERAFRGALLMVDVDHFKRVNDQHGHATGDRVLVEVARRLGAAMRADDLVARWGGEEFLAFAPQVEGAELDQLAERVRVTMARAPIALDNGQALEVTVSIGYAAFPLPESRVDVNWEQAVNLADLSLYTAKNQGRNCAVGIVRTTAGTAAALREVEADIAQARADGRVTMKVSPEAAPREAVGP
ncbi:MAG: diguanylate cyclase domain-containing protein [Burkholderiaceae bacterium]